MGFPMEPNGLGFACVLARGGLTLLLLLFLPTATAAAERRTLDPVRQGPRVAVFRLEVSRPAAIVAARVRVGSRVRALRVRRVRRAVRRGVLRLRWRRIVRTGARRGERPRLRLILTLRPRGVERDVQGMLGTFENGAFRGFDGHSARSGAIDVTTKRAYDGARAAKASYDGSGEDGFARTWFDVNWRQGSDVWYGGAFYISSTAAMPCWYSLMRWDNFATYGPGGDVGGIEVSTAGRGRLVRQDYSGANYAPLTPEFGLPDGRWFWLEVHQRLSSTDGEAINEVFLDERRVGVSRTANSRGRPVDHVRHGFVALAGECASAASIYFDRASVSSNARGPLS